LVDQSGSMSDVMSSGRSKADFVADVLNRTLASLIVRCTRSDGTRDYFDIGVIGYGDGGPGNGLSFLGSAILHPISRLEAAPLRVEERKKKTDDGTGGIFEQTVRFPVWFQPKADGGTPMRAALTQAAEEMVVWCDSHPSSYPPAVLHVTDGESTDGDPEELAGHLGEIQTNDGNILLFNLHVSADSTNPIKFPAAESELPNTYARMLFRMSSILPQHLVNAAQEKGLYVSRESRGFMFNAEAPEIVDFFDIGTRASQLR